MPIKYKYEGRDEKGNKKFSKIYKKQRWVPDWENKCIRDYENYIKEENIPESDIKYIEYFEGTYEAACRNYGLSGSVCKVIDKESKNKEYKRDEKSVEIKIERFKKVVNHHQYDRGLVRKTSAELFTILTSKMRDQYYYIDFDKREDIAIQVIQECYKQDIKRYDDYFLSLEDKKDKIIQDEESLRLMLGDDYTEEDENKANKHIKDAEIKNRDFKRLSKLKYFLKKYPNVRLEE